MAKPRGEMGAVELDLAREKRRIYYRANRAKILAHRRWRRQNDPEHADRIRAQARASYRRVKARRQQR